MIIHAEHIAVHVEPSFVALDLRDGASGVTLRAACTSDHARTIAAELLMAAERADRPTLDGDFRVVA
jgi:hypothetical protein